LERTDEIARIVEEKWMKAWRELNGLTRRPRPSLTWRAALVLERVARWLKAR
jgi:hypothetical protein